LFTSAQLGRYLRCPRQYYYFQTGIGASRELSPGEPFTRAINATLRWVYTEWSQLRTPPIDDLMTRYRKEAGEAGGIEPAYREIYEAQALQMLETVRGAWHNERLRPVSRADRLIARLDLVDVRVDADLIAYDELGRLVIARHLLGKPSDRDHTDPLLALLRRAADDSAPSRSSHIELRYPSTGAKRMIARSEKWEPDRVKKYAQAADGIQSGDFPASPREEGLCARCPYLFACAK
jgi:hypothetical protein